MATTTATSHQQRYKDYSGLPEITTPSAGARDSSERRDYMAQANKHSSRQTMTTVGSSSRFSNNNSELDMLVALQEIKDQNCGFLVAGRKGKDGVYDSPESLQAPAGFESLFQAIPDGLFRRDISSTELRESLKV